jgi:activator of HSP90 ATPase
MTETIECSTVLPASARQIYIAWLSSQGHSAMTGAKAVIDPAVEGRFTAWDGYIQGANLESKPHWRIVQSWRTTEFPEAAPDSHLEVRLESVDGGTYIRLIHTLIPDGQGESYRRGWEEYYFLPMAEYFSTEAET